MEDGLLSRWEFEVWVEDGEVVTFGHIIINHPTEFGSTEYVSTTDGPLWQGVIDAYEEVGLVCPLVVSNDLLRLSQATEPGDV